MKNSKEVVPNQLKYKVMSNSINSQLVADDPLLMCCESVDYSLLGIINVHQAIVLTQKRLIRADLSSDARFTNDMVINLSDVLNIDESTLNGSYRIHARVLGAECVCIFYSQSLAQKFRKALEQAVQRAKAKATSGSIVSALSVEERLKRLTRLHNEKLISDDEFVQKRKQILNGL